MTVQTALSGLLGAQLGLNTVSNDLANTGTTAFKTQSALFEDMLPASGPPGIGTTAEGMGTDLTQGDLTPTGNSLDAAIQGSGYFVTSQNGTQAYTRDGNFQLGANGQLQTSLGAPVLGYAKTGSAQLSPLTINTGAAPATASSKVGVNFSLNSNDPTDGGGNPTQPSSYQQIGAFTAYDSLGNANRVSLYFTREPYLPTNSWKVYAQAFSPSGQNIGGLTNLTVLQFNNAGQLIGGNPGTLNVTWNNGAAPSSIQLDFTGTTLAAQNFGLNGTTNNGAAPGNYQGTSLGADGSVNSTYSNGQTITAGRLALANFINPQALTPLSGNLYAATSNAGSMVLNPPGSGQAGTLQSGVLEGSNASSSSLLVSLIQFQQAYQANSSVIQTEKQDSQRLVQIG